MNGILRQDTALIEYWSAISLIMIGIFSWMYPVFSAEMSLYQSNLNWSMEMLFIGSIHILSVKNRIDGLRKWCIIVSSFFWMMFGFFDITTSVSTSILSFGLSIGLTLAFFSRSFVRWR